MPGPSSIDPVGEATLNIYKLYDRRKRAELDLQLARAEEAHGARTAVPGVVATLSQQAQKAAAAQQKIKDAQQQGQLSQAAMMPPMVDVTGQPGRRSAIGQSIASEIADQVTGGKAVKMNLPGVGIVAGGAGPPPTGAPAGAQQQQLTPVGPGYGGAPPLSGLQRFLSGVGAAVGLAARNPGAVSRGIEEAATGQRAIDYQAVPTVDQMAQSLATPIAVYRSRMASTDPNTAAEGQKLHQEALDRVRQEFGDVVADKTESFSNDLYYMADEERRRKEEDPATRAQREHSQRIWTIDNKIIDGIPLTPGEQQFHSEQIRSKQTQVTINNPQPPITEATRSKLEEGIKGSDDLLNKLNAIDEALHLDDGTFWNAPFEFNGRKEHVMLTGRDYLGALSPEERGKLQRYADVEQTLAMMTVEQMHTWLGATMSDAEIRAAYPMLPNASKNAATNEQDLKRLREITGLAKMRYQVVLQSGSMADPRYTKSLSDTKSYARELAGTRIKEVIQQGSTPQQAADQVRDEFRRGYGLNVDELLGIKQPLPALR